MAPLALFRKFPIGLAPLEVVTLPVCLFHGVHKARDDAGGIPGARWRRCAATPPCERLKGRIDLYRVALAVWAVVPDFGPHVIANAVRVKLVQRWGVDALAPATLAESLALVGGAGDVGRAEIYGFRAFDLFLGGVVLAAASVPDDAPPDEFGSGLFAASPAMDAMAP